MRPSLTRGSAQALRNIAKVRARRERFQLSLANAEQPTTPTEGKHILALPRFLGSNPKESAQKRLEELLNTPGVRYQQVWETYLALRQIVNVTRSGPIPQEIVRKVLRKCTPDWHITRKSCAQPGIRQTIWQRLENPLPFGNRLFEIITHMTEAGQVLDKEDFDYILHYMAAGGHVHGTAAVLKRMDKEGIIPSTFSYQQAIRASVFLLESDVPPVARPAVAEMANNLAFDVIQRIKMQNKVIPLTILELILRVLKADDNAEAAEKLLRENCAFDVHKPDRMPEEFQHRLKEADKLNRPLPRPTPISTSILSTMVNLYGTRGDIPKMITLFEVLTNPYPLPSNLPSPSSDWWDIEDEYDVPQPVNQKPLPHRSDYTWEPPRASPNNATFAYLLRNLAWAGQRMLCEHYILLAEEYDKAEALNLRTMLKNKMRDHEASQDQSLASKKRENTLTTALTAPRFLITPLMFMPVFAHANHLRIAELMRWMMRHLRDTVERREKELVFLREALSVLPAEATSAWNVHSASRQQPYSDFTGVVPRTAPRTPLDLRTHISLVESSLVSFKAMLERTEDATARIIQRTKERLTRRVWNNKDIFLRDVNARVIVSRAEWERKVNWKEWTRSLPGARPSLMAPQIGGVPSRWMDERLAARVESKTERETGGI